MFYCPPEAERGHATTKMLIKDYCEKDTKLDLPDVLSIKNQTDCKFEFAEIPKLVINTC